MKNQPKREKVAKEVNPLEKIRSLAEAARQIQAEEQLMLKFDPAGKRVN